VQNTTCKNSDNDTFCTVPLPPRKEGIFSHPKYRTANSVNAVNKPNMQAQETNAQKLAE